MTWCTKSWGWLTTRADKMVHTASELVVIVGLPIAIYQLGAARREAYNHALEAHEQVYTVLDAQYTDFLKLCLQNPDVDCFDLPAKPEPSLDEGQRARQRILYAIVIPMLEHAYLAYHGQSAVEIADLTERQWPGWELYASNFMQRPAFRQIWRQLGVEFDKRFQNCMNTLPTPNGEPSEACNPWNPLNWDTRLAVPTRK
jgi:hypothetical protein